MKIAKFWKAARSSSGEASRSEEASNAFLAVPAWKGLSFSPFRNAINLLHSTLREIFDESAYARFLARRQIATSPQAYADFLRETQAHRERRPRCC